MGGLLKEGERKPWHKGERGVIQPEGGTGRAGWGNTGRDNKTKGMF